MTLERVDPALVPQRLVAGGALMPGIGLGTFGSDHVPGEQVAAAVLDASSWAIGISTARRCTATSS